MTYVEIVNAVLRRLRETEVNAVSDSEYSTLVGDFVIATKREVEAATNWTVLRQAIPINTVQGTSQYSLTGAGKRFTTLDVYNVTDDQSLFKTTALQGRKDVLIGTEGVPSEYFYEGVDSNGDIYVHISPVPDGVYTLNFNLVVPQTDSPNSTDQMLLDEWPLIQGAYSKAVSERGEDSGRTSGEAREAYRLALGDAVALDVERSFGEDVWHV
jgi:hypothetical protein